VPVDSALATLHFRVQMAGTDIERAASFLNQREVLRGRMALQSAVYNLSSAAVALKQSGQYPNQLAFVQQLVAFYTGQMNSVLRPATGPSVASTLLSNQGNLLSADST
jgi:hypothetical protein